jgi:adenylate cyclase
MSKVEDIPPSRVEDILTPVDLLALVKTAGELAARIDLDDLLHEILNRAGQLTDSPEGAILLYSPERGTLFFADAIGGIAPQLLEKYGESSEEQVPVKGSKAGGVFLSGESIVVDSVAADPGHFKGVDEETGHTTQSMVCVPLSAGGERLGAMQLLNKRSGNYDRRDRVLLEQFAGHAAVAIRNARLFEDLISHMGLYASREFRGGAADLLKQLRSPAAVEKLTVMFADMRGFRLLCQVVNHPERILHMSNQFITLLSRQVLRHGGVVNKFLGDGILALFRYGDHAQRAVTCAFAMAQKFNALRKEWDDESNAQLDFLDIGIGITTDHMIIGTIGNEKIRDFTAIGTAVNLAAAFENDARGGRRILVDQLTYLAVKDSVAEVEGPVNYELRQPDQRVGNYYKQYHLKSLTAARRHRAFISHSHLDREFVEGELIKTLGANGIDYWYSKDDIKAGSSWVQSITEGLERCDWMLVVVSAASARSEWVKDEVNMAAAHPYLRSRIIPVCLDDTPPGDVHLILGFKQAVMVEDGEAYAEKLLETIKSKE